MTRTWYERLTDFAFLLTLALVVARATALETLRDPFEVTPTSEYVPRALTAAASLWLDWLAYVPALLILARQWLDPGYTILRLRCLWPLFALAVWAGASIAWANDKFAAVVGASHFVSAAVLLWSAAQLARDAGRYRIVAGVAFGLLLVLTANGLIYRFVELPDLQRSVERNWQTIVEQRGWEPESFTAQRFRQRALAGEMVGFSASANTFAAMLVMLSLVAIGIIAQRATSTRDERPYALIGAFALLPALWLLRYTNSRAAIATLILGALILAARPVLSAAIARRRRLVFTTSLVVIFACAAAVIGYGVAKNSLIHDSLTFRWRYWVGAARLVQQHPVAGVGWNNFGDRYLAVREPIAAEEVKDPHSLPVRLAAELGVVGLLLALTWLVWMWWDLTKPRDEPAGIESSDPPARGKPALQRLAWVAGAGILLNVLASLDLLLIWNDFAWVFIELMKRGLYFGLLLGGLVVVAFRSFDTQDPDDRPSPWIRAGMLVALGMFLLHNSIDFAFFESGPMWTFMLLAGATLGSGGASSRRASSGRGGLSFATAVVLSIAVLGALVLPVTVAESNAHSADEAVRAEDPARAASLLLDAHSWLPFSNADYLFRAARAQVLARAPSDEVRQTLLRAIAENPTSPAPRAMLAQLEAREPSPDLSRVRAAFEDVLRLDPNEVQLRLTYAETLGRLGDRAGMVEQYRAALAKNDQLHPDEPKRLSPARVEEIRSRLSP